MAEATGGQALVLESASLLATVIQGGAQEEVGLTRLEREVGEVMREAGGGGGEEEEEVWVARVEEVLRRKGTRTRQLKTNMRRMTSAQAEVIASCSSLEEAKTRLEGEGGREEEEEEDGERLSVSTGLLSLSCGSFLSAAAAAAPADMRGGSDGSSSVSPSRIGWEGGKEEGRDGKRGRARLMAQYLISRRGGGGIPTVRTAPAAAIVAAATTTTVTAATATTTAAATEIPPAMTTLERGASRGGEKGLSATHPKTTTTRTGTAVPTSCSSSIYSSLPPSLPAPLFSPTHTQSLTACAAVGTEGGGRAGGWEGGRAEVTEEEISIDQIRRLVRKAQSLQREGLGVGQSAACPPSSSPSSFTPSSPPSSLHCSLPAPSPLTRLSHFHAPTL